MANKKILAAVLILSMVAFFAMPVSSYAGPVQKPSAEMINGTGGQNNNYTDKEDVTFQISDYLPGTTLYVLVKEPGTGGSDTTLSAISSFVTGTDNPKSYNLWDLFDEGYLDTGHAAFKYKLLISTDPAVPNNDCINLNFWVPPAETYYTVTFMPGEQGTFPITTFGGLEAGDLTPSPPDITGHSDYEFDGWLPELLTYVEGDATYVAQWIASEEEGASIALDKEVGSSLSGPWNDTLVVSSLGPHIAYRFTVTNDGDYPLQNVTISDPDLSLSGVTLTPMPITIDALAVDETTTRSIECDLMDLPSTSWDGNVFLNEATARGYYSVPTNNVGATLRELPYVENSDTAEVTYSILTSEAAIHLDKTVAPASVTSRDEEVTYTFTVTNEGDYPLYGVSVSDAAIGVLIYFDTTLISEGDYFTTTRAFDLSNLGTDTYGSWDGDVFINTAMATAYYGQKETRIWDDDSAQVTYNTPTERRTRRTTVTEEPVPAAPVPIPEIVLDEPVPAAPLPKTGGLDPMFLYGLGLMVSSGGFMLKRRK